MCFFNSKKKNIKRLNQLCGEVAIFIQVHYVRERNSERYKYNVLALKENPEREALQVLLDENDHPETFSDLVLMFFQQSNKDENAILEKAQLPKGYFSKLRDSKTFRPSKPEALALCIALKLNMEECRVLLKSAEYALSNSSETDLTVRYFIENQLYSISDLNYVLDKLHETSLEQLS